MESHQCINTVKVYQPRDFPGGPVAWNLPSNEEVCRFDPWLRSWDLICLMARKPKHRARTLL